MTNYTDETTGRGPDLDSTVGTAGAAIDDGADQTRGPALEEPILDLREALFNDGSTGTAPGSSFRRRGSLACVA